MDFIARIYFNDTINDIALNNRKSLSVGSGKKDSYVVQDKRIKSKHIRFIQKKGVWHVICRGKTYLSSELIKGKIIEANDTYVLDRDKRIAVSIIPVQTDGDTSLDISSLNEVIIGRYYNCDILFNNKRLTKHHAKICKQGLKFHICDTNSKNGTYLNDRRIQDSVLRDGDVITIDIYKILFQKERLFFKNIGGDLKISIAPKQTTQRANGYPYFIISPRMKLEVPSGEIEIQAPPQQSEKPQLNLIPILLPTIGMMIPAVITGALGMLYFSVPMAITGVLVSLSGYSTQKKKHMRIASTRSDKYERYLKEIISDLTEKEEQQRDILRTIHPTLKRCFSIVQNMERRLWERTSEDADFMQLKLGDSTQPFCMNIKIPKKGIVLDEDPFQSRPAEIKKQFSFVKDIPTCTSLIQYPTMGIVGDRQSAIEVAHNIIVQAATHHSYENVKIVTLFSQAEAKHWDWMRWLPHSWDDSHQSRYMASSRFKATEMLKEFEETIKIRERDLNDDNIRNKGLKLPYILFVVADRTFVEGETILHHITKNNIHLGVGVVMLFDNISCLPSECSTVVEVNRNKATLSLCDSAKDLVNFSIEHTDNMLLDGFARSMAPIRSKTLSVEGKLPNCVTLLQGYNVKKPEEIDIEKLWKERVAYKSMSVPIGVKANGDPFHFDIWEKAHGPFGQVAGMPGSGKSEMIQSWILSMALNFSPEDVSFVLIDFKGTGLLLPFMGLPHLAGSISDIDTNIKRNLISLESEMRRRKELFNSHGVQFAKEYLTLRKSGEAVEPCPFVMIVIDEFAEMKIQFPDFMPVIDSIFGIGRSLGMYCVLMSQKPGGVVSPKVEANTKFRWCLRVASAAESKEMIHHAGASKITVPGRSYVRVGDDDVFELVQSYWSGAPYNANANVVTASSVKISTVDLDGTRHRSENTVQTTECQEEIKEINAIVDYLGRYVKEHDMPRTNQIWMPKLEENIPLEVMLDKNTAFDGTTWKTGSDSISPVVGMIDDPYSQTAYPFKLEITEEGHVVVFGAPGSGKTTFLQTLAVSLALSYTPDEVQIYAMDFGSWGLKPLSKLPHVGGIALDSEEEKVMNLSLMLTKILGERRQGFAEHGVNSVKAYSEVIGKPVPNIIVMVDNFAPVLEIYPDLDSFFMTLARSGSGYGIYFITTATSISSIAYRIAQNIKQHIALQMIDKTDYQSIVGHTDGLEPSKTPGRGLVKVKMPLEFQTAVYGKCEEFVAEIHALSETLSNAWEGECAQPIPVMPDIVLKKDFVRGHENGVPLGLSVGLDPVFFSRNHRTALVSGPEKSGKTNALKILADTGDDNTQIIWFDIDGKLSGFPEARIVTTDEEMVEVLSELNELINEQNKNKPTDSRAILIIDNLPVLMDRIPVESCDHLENIAENGKKADVCLYVSGEYNELNMCYSRGDSVLQTIISEGVSIVTGGKFSQHRYLSSSTLSYTEMEEELPEFFGYYTARGKTIKIKLVSIV